MSLSKQLGFGLFIVLIMMFVGTLWTNTVNTRDFISKQLTSHAQDTATSLGLSVTPYIGEPQQFAIVETMANAIFDRGYYSLIQINDLDGNELIKLESTQSIDEVPSWFMHLFDIQAPRAETQLTSGWQLQANLFVTSHTGLAYQQLWANAVHNFWLTLIIFTLALSVIFILVKKLITQPIDQVIAQTEKISQQHFIQIEKLPKTSELQKFVNAVNFMSNKLSVLFTKLSEQSEKYRLFAYTDSLTKVGNRRAFELYLKQLLRNGNDRHSGYLFIIKASSLEKINLEQGGVFGNSYLTELVTICKQISAEHYTHFAIYRLSGSDFAIVLENTSSELAIKLAKELNQGFKRAEKTEHQIGFAHIGITGFEYQDDFTQVLNKADNALSVACLSEKRWEISENLKVNHSKDEWITKILELLNEGTSDFASQSIVDKNNQIEYAECFARLPNEANSNNLPMAQLIPASIRLDYAKDLDKLIVENLLNKLVQSENLIGLNLSRLSILDTEFMTWFVSKLQIVESHCHKLVIEVSERALVHDIESLIEQVKRLKAFDVKITVEHFGAQLAGIRHLRKLQPDYLKIDGRFTKNIHKEADNQLFVHSLLNIAHGLHIKVIAEMIETEAERDWLVNADIDLLQGYFIGAPRPL